MGGFVQHSALVPKDIQGHALRGRDTKKCHFGADVPLLPRKNRQKITGMQPQKWSIVRKRRLKQLNNNTL